MVHDRDGDVVETNVTATNQGMIYLVLLHPEAVRLAEEAFDERGFVLVQIPARDEEDPEADPTPFYFPSPRRKP